MCPWQHGIFAADCHNLNRHNGQWDALMNMWPLNFTRCQRWTAWREILQFTSDFQLSYICCHFPHQTLNIRTAFRFYTNQVSQRLAQPLFMTLHDQSTTEKMQNCKNQEHRQERSAYSIGFQLGSGVMSSWCHVSVHVSVNVLAWRVKIILVSVCVCVNVCVCVLAYVCSQVALAPPTGLQLVGWWIWSVTFIF